MDGTAHGPLTSENDLVRHLFLKQEEIERSAVVRVPIGSLVTSATPRLGGEDLQHVRTLAESGVELPPIVVHIPSRKVIDGMHRLRAAVLRGETEIEARFFRGTENDVFLLAVAANIEHGLPLSQHDRMAAAERIFHNHPEWSDRMVAVVVGLSGKKVGALRRRAAHRLPRTAARIGRDGRARPIDGAIGRERAAKVIAGNPDASLRQIAREAGISPATAADVRDRLRRGEDPVVTRRATRSADAEPPGRIGAPGADEDPPAKLSSELAIDFERLRRDPSLRFTEAGRVLLRMFDALQAFVRDEESVKKGLPPHRLALMAELSHAYAETLRSLAAELRTRQSSQMAKDCGSPC